MPLLIIQMGHCYRTTGATGTTGEQSFASKVARSCLRLLHGRGGWTTWATLADQDIYDADAFVAIHCDGSTNTAARGASAGYRTREGQRFAQDWKRAYAVRGWSVFRPDNYTAALAGYYGVREAVAAGTRRAMIVECGFLTNPTERAVLTGPGGADRVALAIGDALGIPHDHLEETPVKNLILANKLGVDGKPSGEIWVGDGISRRHVADPAELAGLQYWIQQRGGEATVHEFADLRVLGEDIGAPIQLPPVPIELDYGRFVTDVVTQLASKLGTLRFEPKPEGSS